MNIPLEERTHELLLFTKTTALNALIEQGYIRMGNGGVDPVSLAKLMNEYVLYAPSNAETIAKMVGQPVNLVYGKLLQHMDLFEGQRNEDIKRVDSLQGTIYLCPIAKLEEVLLERNTKHTDAVRHVSAASTRPRRERKSEKVVIYEGVPLGRNRQYTREEIISSTINKSRLERLISAGVLPDADSYSENEIEPVLRKMEGKVLVDELIEDCLTEADAKEKFDAAKARIYISLQRPEIQRTYGVSDIGIGEPLYTAEKDRLAHIVRKVVDSL